MKHVSTIELVLMLCIVGFGSWLLSFVLLGWIGSGAVWLWAKSKGLKMKTPSQDFFLHFLGPALAFLPFMPAAIGQILALYTANKKA